MKSKTKYQVIVFSDQHAEHRQFQITSKTLIFLAASVVFGLIGLIATGTLFVRGYAHRKAVEALEGEKQMLLAANQQYKEATQDIKKKLLHFEERTTKLAQFVGVTPVDEEMDGLGGAELFEDHTLNAYLRSDLLGKLDYDADELDERLNHLETAYQDHRERLDSTPSILPASGWISSGFGYRTDPFTSQRARHNGLDISSPTGTPIYAPADGVVSFQGYKTGFGNTLEISHRDGMMTRYGHLSKFNVSKGQRIKRKDLIGFVGNTGRSTAPHLHYEILVDGTQVNPMKFIFDDSKTY